MNVFELTRKLIDIESITPNELAIGEYLAAYLSPLAERHGGRVERIQVEPDRYNVLACFGNPLVTLSTHQDTVPPFIASSEDDDNIWGRGACDVKGIIASMILAAERLLEEGKSNFALLFVVGEERNSLGAYAASRDPRGSKFLINGEPTENRLALGSKGALRYEITASGRMAHSAYPELGESAIEKLLDALVRVRAVNLPVDEVLGPSTLNIGTITGGRAPNVIPDRARAEVMIRLVGDPDSTRLAISEAVSGIAEAKEVLCIPAIHLGSVPGIETTVVSYTTDIPAFGGAWGKPYLIGPGAIHVAHTSEERVPKKQLLEAIDIYQRMVKLLLQEV
ncbi:MAG: M20/M25/M40 family metallo-hydrolase [Acidimicrobiia bacterium]|nr:M20/M25/M40 family metallo-hydrolase [Acidimicrobiia bacterium]